MKYYQPMSIAYDLRKSLKSLDWPKVADPQDCASRLLTRADERLRRAPTHELTRAARLLALRRRIDRQAPETIQSRKGLLALIGRQTDEFEPEWMTDRTAREGRGLKGADILRLASY
jgi:hypothetical protein